MFLLFFAHYLADSFHLLPIHFEWIHPGLQFNIRVSINWLHYVIKLFPEQPCKNVDDFNQTSWLPIDVSLDHCIQWLYTIICPVIGLMSGCQSWINNKCPSSLDQLFKISEIEYRLVNFQKCLFKIRSWLCLGHRIWSMNPSVQGFVDFFRTLSSQVAFDVLLNMKNNLDFRI